MNATLKTSLLQDAKLRLRLHTNAFDDEVGDLIDAAVDDLLERNAIQQTQISGTTIAPLIKRAIMTYCRAFFGDPDNQERLKADYDEQKATLMMTSGYTNWEES